MTGGVADVGAGGGGVVRCCGREGGVGDGGVPRVVYWMMVVELFLVFG